MIAWASAWAVAACDGCHAAEREAWAASRHASAFDGPEFQAVWGRFRDPWCLGCHTPDTGVGCEACHARGGAIATAAPPSAAGEEAHALVVDPDLGTTACLPCHQFDGPGGGGAAQTTGDEHAAWAGDRSCAACHAGGHGIASSSDPASLAGVVTAEVRRRRGQVEATVTVTGVGHRFPTGDPWRRLVLELLDRDQVVRRWTFARTVTGVGPSFREASDTRPPLPDRSGRATLEVSADVVADRWRLTYARVDPSHDSVPADLRGFVIASGDVLR